MSMTDPVADMLTMIRNATGAKKPDMTVSSSRFKQEILKILKEEGYIKDFSVIKEDGVQRLKIQFKYPKSKKGIISSIVRQSKPGLRRYVGKDALPKVLNGLGIAIVSTSKGVMTDRSARELGIGGELICTVY
jgi:small subunit ribosomal protein S8